ncbi:Saccharopine dehydrogenase [NAD(+), L-lysine-forming] [Stylophora pistillata]|uniref:Saccharopine dehydrogenase [NAD(+), L-lysine-forming] n=1 Tax=Stylophora pistillata TaxID=50429 RepID=A0A2B4RQC6_STYPI|nr:Saccharopine dehydrogenase [NAD(+), L-lysine-forming] [Stylophora pistillata]
MAESNEGVPEVFPRVFVIGARGRCGRGAVEMAHKMGVPKSNITEWNTAETKGKGPFAEILECDIFVNCILLKEEIPPFLTKEMLDTDERSLSIVVDVSCDPNSPNNPLPFYDACTSFKQPSVRVSLPKSSKPLDVVAIDHLPSLLPRESSTRFANDSTPHLLKLDQNRKRMNADRRSRLRDVKIFCQQVQSHVLYVFNIEMGFKVTVECSRDRVFKDEEFARISGVDMVPEGSWVDAPKEAFILGIKELAKSLAPIPHTHIYFAHAYDNQNGWAEVLNRFIKGGGRILDVEYMTDEYDRRVAAAFPPLAGFAGMAVGISAWCHQQMSPQTPMPAIKPYGQGSLLIEDLKTQLQDAAKARGLSECYPCVIIIGALGRCGKGAIDLAQKVGLPSSCIAKWDTKETQQGGPFEEILQYDIFVNCINLMKKIPPFMTRKVLDTDQRKLSVIVDVSCDVTNPNNPLPFCESVTSLQQPCKTLQLSNSTTPLDIVAIDNLPSLLPRESSIQFANSIMPYLLKLPEVDTHPVWVRAGKKFEEKAAEVLYHNVKC